MGCTSSVQAISIEPKGPDEEDKDNQGEPNPRQGTEETQPKVDNAALPDIAERTHPEVSATLPNQPVDDDEQNLYVPPMSPQKLESIEKWLNELPPSEDVIKDVQENPVVNEVTDAACSEQSSACREALDERRSSLTAEHLKQHTRAMSSSKGKGAPGTPQGVANAMQDTFHSDSVQLPGGPGENTMSSPGHPQAPLAVQATSS